MHTVLRTMLTESDNSTHDIFRYMALASVLVGLGLECYVVLRGQPFDLQQFGTGIGLLLTGAGVALKLKPESTTGKTG